MRRIHFRLLLGTTLAVALGLAALMAKGFGCRGGRAAPTPASLPPARARLGVEAALAARVRKRLFALRARSFPQSQT